MRFDELGLAPELLKAIADEGYTQPTPIQAQAIPIVLSGRDLMGGAQTGTGKTAAFALPLLQRILPFTSNSPSPARHPVRVLILAPTRELAIQVYESVVTYARYLPIRSLCTFGGVDIKPQIEEIRRGVEVLVATPGRLLDLVEQKCLNFGQVQALVLDEADRMLDMGFIDDIKTIVAATPESRQTLLFSATWDGEVGKLARNLTKNPEVIEIERVDEQGKIEEQLLYCDDKNHKNRLLDHILRDANIDQCVIFTATKSMSEQLADELYEKGFAANCLHGDMPQGWRNRTLNDLRRGRTKILVATDVAARGIDVPTITHVINYDLPKQAEDYVHRIGRTGRAGRTGLAISFADAREYMLVHKIERYLKRQLPEAVIAGMEPTRKRSKNVRPESKGKGGWGKNGYSRNGKGGYGRDSKPRSGKPGYSRDGSRKPRDGKPERRSHG